jgi:outer membrane protein TolC
MRRAVVFALASGLPALLAGCAQAPPRVPDVALAERILPLPPAPVAEVERPCEPAIAGPLTLEQALALALENQPRLRVARESIHQAVGRAEVAFAPFLPTATAYSRAFAAENPDQLRVPLPALELGTARGGQNFVVQELLLQWTLWDFGRTYGRSQQAGFAVDIAQLQLTRAEQTVAFDVAAAYFRLLQARAAGVAAREAVRRAESILDITRKSLAAGLVERDRVLRAEVQLAQEQRAVVNATRDERVAVAGLNLAIGISVNAPTEVADRTDEPVFEQSLAECLQAATAQRREFAVASRAIDSAQEGVRVARAEFAPQVIGQGAVAYTSGRKYFVGDAQSGSIIINWDLFAGGKRQGQLRTSNAGLRAATAQAQVVCDTIAWEVNEAYQDVTASRQAIALARPAVEQARENLRLVSRRYEAGDATPTDIVDAETALTRAEQNLYTARYDYLTALARIAYATGQPRTPP